MAVRANINLQDSFLNLLRKDNVPVSIFLVNGYQIKGVIKGFDNFVILCDEAGKNKMIYKHAVSTIEPFRPITFSFSIPKEDAEA